MNSVLKRLTTRLLRFNKMTVVEAADGTNLQVMNDASAKKDLAEQTNGSPMKTDDIDPISKSSTKDNTEKLKGRQLFEAIGKPRTILAPMVDQSELAWRILSRRYGAELCYTPMFHARLFSEDPKYRDGMWSEMDGDPNVDRPLIVQFCANDPEYFLSAAKKIQHKCDAVDLNLGCSVAISKRGNYGSKLMEDWDRIWRLINKLHNELDVPITAKIRIYDDREKTLQYAKHVLSAGAQFLTVHARTREMLGSKTGLADWETIRYLRENLPEDTVIFANGNNLYTEDINRCMEETKADSVMSAEGNLYNPGIFNIDKQNNIDDLYPRVDKLLREYFEICKTTPGNGTKSAMKSHFFKIMRHFLPHHTDIRNQIGPIRKGEYDKFESIVKQVEARVAQIYADGAEDVIVENGDYKEIPIWRCQPYYREKFSSVNGKRKTDGEDSENKEQKVE